MTRKDKVNYLRIALSLQKITSDDKVCDQIIETYESILQKGGEFNIKDAAKIEEKMRHKYAKNLKNNKT